MTERSLPDAAATEAVGATLAADSRPKVIYLEGDLGAGKTTLVRGFLRSLGVEGRVKSPTFSLMEAYQTRAGSVFHLDLYRLSDPDEAAFLGLDDFEAGQDWLLVEWPDHGAGWLPAPDLTVRLDFHAQGRLVTLKQRKE